MALADSVTPESAYLEANHPERPNRSSRSILNPGTAAEGPRNKAERLSKSLPLDVHRWSEDGRVDAAVEALHRELETLPAYRTRKGATRRRLLKVAILNLYANWLMHPALYTSYDRMKEKYRSFNRYNELRISFGLVGVVDGLTELGYVEGYRGFYVRNRQRSRTSRMRATDKLLVLLCQDCSFVPAVVQTSPDREAIVLRKAADGGSNREIEYRDDSNTSAWRNEPCTYNALLDGTAIGLDGLGQLVLQVSGNPYVDLLDRFVYRVFNEARWDRGGRFYGGWWQRVPRRLRARILLNGEPTNELDFSGLYIVLLYAMAGIDYWGEVNRDPYDLSLEGPSAPPRALAKLVTLCAINSANQSQAIRAVRWRLASEPEFADLRAISSRGSIASVINAFTRVHRPVANSLFSGSGLRMQNIDSQIAERVIATNTALGRPVLAIHDSFVISRRHEADLHRMMVDGFQRVAAALHPRFAKQAISTPKIMGSAEAVASTTGL